jgi:hypothetical protein
MVILMIAAVGLYSFFFKNKSLNLVEMMFLPG